MKKAFTLIELLVVIAIIAILAAILFPVFAQAKLAAKKTQTLSNLKQMGTAVAIYQTDADDNNPLSCSVNTAGSWRWSTIHPFPNGAIGSGWDAAAIQAQVAIQWASSIYPYTKSYGLYRSATGTSSMIPGEVLSALAGAPKPQDCGLMYNGLMHGYSGSSVASPSLVPLLWGSSSYNMTGRSMTNPALECSAAAVGGVTQPCMFNPGGLPQTGAGGTAAMFTLANFFPSWTVWNYGTDANSGGAVYVRADTSAKISRAGTLVNPQYHNGAETDPYALVSAYASGGPVGGSFSYWTTSQGDCSAAAVQADNGANQYPCFFRPDRTN